MLNSKNQFRCHVCLKYKDISQYSSKLNPPTFKHHSCTTCADEVLAFRKADMHRFVTAPTMALSIKCYRDHRDAEKAAKKAIPSIYRTVLNGVFSKSKYAKKSEQAKLLGCSIEQFKIHIESQFTEDMSWENRPTTWHLDHFIPISAAKTDEDSIALSHYTNFRPLLIFDNLSKGARIPAQDEVLSFFNQFPESPALNFYLLNLIK